MRLFLLAAALVLLSAHSGHCSKLRPFLNLLATPDVDDDMDSADDHEGWDKHEMAGRVRLCAGKNKEQKCECAKVTEKDGAEHTELKCGAQNLASANVELPEGLLPLGIAHLDNNKITYLAKNKILPGNEAQVLHLDLSMNEVADIQPGAFDAFARLQVLKMTHNDLDSDQMSSDVFTAALGKSLHSLYLDYNFIKGLDDGVFDNLKSLTKLVLDGNKGLELSQKIFSPALAKLEMLSLDKCGISALDEDMFQHLTNLRGLSLSGNPIDAVPSALFHVPKLSILAMSDTRIKQIGEGDLVDTVPNVQKLYMRKMKFLRKLGNCAFCGLQSLQKLDFSFSPRLSELSENIFGQEKPLNLSSLNVASCNLETLSENIMPAAFWATMDQIRLEGNPWRCDCKLQWLVQQREVVRRISTPNEPKCAAPEQLSGMSLYSAFETDDMCSVKETAAAASSAGTLFAFLVFAVLAATLALVGAVYARKRYIRMNGSVAMPRFLGGGSSPPRPQMGFGSERTIYEEVEEGDDGEIPVQESRNGPQVAGEFSRPEFV